MTFLAAADIIRAKQGRFSEEENALLSYQTGVDRGEPVSGERRLYHMHDYTREDILRLVEEEDVAFIRLQFTDIFGVMKNMAVTVSQLEKAMDNRCMFDASSLEGLSGESDSDMYLCPDLSTFEIFPWRPQQGKVARLICDVYRQDGTPYEGDPRYVLKKAVARAAEMGYTLNAGPECEFFLFHTDEDGLPTTLTHEQGGYFDVGPVDFG